MSDTGSNLTDFTDEDLANEAIPPGLRAAARTARESARQAAEAQREVMFLRAGVDTKSADPQKAALANMLFKTYEGDEAGLVAQAKLVGLLGDAPATTTTPPPKTQAELDAEEQARVRQGLPPTEGRPAGESTGRTEASPKDAALIGYHDDRKNGMGEDEARLKAMATVIGSAMSGDKRALFDQDAHSARAADIEAGERRVGGAR